MAGFSDHVQVGQTVPANALLLFERPTENDMLAIEAKDLQVQAGFGGASMSDAELIKLCAAGAFKAVTNVTRDGYGNVATADLVFHDGSAGSYTLLSVDATYGEPLEWEATHADSSKKVVQDPITLDANGLVVTQPALRVVNI